MSQLEIAKKEITRFCENKLNAWVAQIASDIHTGKLDAFIAQARAEDTAGRTKTL